MAGEPVFAALPHHALQQLTDVLRVLGELTGAVGEPGLHGGVLQLGAGPAHQTGSSQEHQDSQEELRGPHGDGRTDWLVGKPGHHDWMTACTIFPCVDVLPPLTAALYWLNTADTDCVVPRPAHSEPPPPPDWSHHETVKMELNKTYKSYKLYLVMDNFTGQKPLIAENKWQLMALFTQRRIVSWMV